MGLYDDVMQPDTGISPAVDPLAAVTARGGIGDTGEDQFLPDLSEQDYNRVYGGTGSGTKGIVGGFTSGGVDLINASGRRGKISRLAQSFVGTPYVWGGTSPSGFDCSGFVQYVFGKMGIQLPRVSYQQANAGTRVGLKNLQAGDLVAWDLNNRNNGADHIAIYIGNGFIAEAPRPGVALRVRKLGRNEGAWGVRILNG